MSSELRSARSASRVAPGELDRLEREVRRLLDAHDALRRRADEAEARAGEVEAAMQQLAGGDLDPVALADEVERLTARNRELHERMEAAHAAVERMLARLRFAGEEP